MRSNAWICVFSSPFVIDSNVPAEAVAFYYLVRTLEPNLGSTGR